MWRHLGASLLARDGADFLVGRLTELALMKQVQQFTALVIVEDESGRSEQLQRVYSLGLCEAVSAMPPRARWRPRRSVWWA